MDKEKVLVAGANGTTGRMIIQLLKESNLYTPIAMVRTKEQNNRFEKDNVATVMADLTANLTEAVMDADKVIFAAGSKGKNVIAVDQEGAKKMTDAAQLAGIKKFVMLSSMGADNPSQSESLKDYLKAKQNADEHLRESGVPYSIVRPGQLTDNGPTGKIELKEKLNKAGKISRADVAKTLVEVLNDKVQNNTTFEIIAGEDEVAQAVL
ncbi:SDR family oxidoreductase [Crocinitomix catalasitica]|uniref:SDR family oxidoreductase n=1 Tax=Crocinitomix catalasitica TaxID=184607 RepID=UPI000488269B|nr:SDR family oxidoreductase [Crocinitomix catalasitica]